MSFWNDSRADETRRRWLDGQSARQIAYAVGCGCTRNAVLGKINRMGLLGHREKSFTNRPIWRVDEDETLRELRAGGKTAASIAQTIGRSQGSIEYRLRHLGIKPPMAAPRAPRAPRAHRGEPSAAPKPFNLTGQAKTAAARLAKAERLVTAAGLAASIRCDEMRAPNDGVAFVDHTDAMCRWVLGSPADLIYCGAARIGHGPYCGAHDKMSVSAESFRARFDAKTTGEQNE
jgi:hypothetical protein